jgi:rare lipoprotein A
MSSTFAVRFAAVCIAAVITASLIGCASAPPKQAASSSPRPVVDGPGNDVPASILSVPDATVTDEPPLPGPNRPYTVLGETYTPDTARKGFTQRGLATWYGKKFHGNRTASGEIYDMYAMTAAHRTLPIPSYARVTVTGGSRANLGRSVIVRINDRGPFGAGRVIDLSYTAAAKLGFVRDGKVEVMVERVFKNEAAASAAQ